MYLYAVCLNTDSQHYPDDWWIEFYWAEDSDHAEEQGENAHPNCAIVCVAIVPTPDGSYLQWDGEFPWEAAKKYA